MNNELAQMNSCLYSVAENCLHWRSCRRSWHRQPGLPPKSNVVYVFCRPNRRV